MPKILATLLLLVFTNTGFSQRIVIEHSDKTPKPSILEEGKFKVFLVNDTSLPIHLFYSHHREYGGTETTSEKLFNGASIEATNKWKPMDTNSRYGARAIATVPAGKKKHISTMIINEKKAGIYVLKYRINQDPTTVDKRYAENGAAVAAVSKITKMDIEGTFEYTIKQLKVKPFVANKISYEELQKQKNKTFEEAKYDPSSVFAMHVALKSAAEATELFGRLAKLKNVAKLSIYANSDEDIVVPASIGTLPLMDLSLSRNKSHKGNLILPSNFLQTNNLRKVSLSGLKAMDASLLVNQKEIEQLSINKCDMSNSDWLGDLVSLKELQISQTNLQELPANFKNLTNLTRLNLGRNNISSIENLPAATGLKNLNMEDNSLTSLPSSINQLSALTYLNCQKNKISAFPEDMSGLTGLKDFKLNSNNLTKLSASIADIKSLKDLYLQDNSLTELPQSLGTLPALSKLYLTNNKFSKFPQGLSQSSTLSDLYINKNKISDLTTELTKIRSLRMINFEDNKVTSLPNGFTEMKLYRVYTKGNLLDKKVQKKMKKDFGRKLRS